MTSGKLRIFSAVFATSLPHQKIWFGTCRGVVSIALALRLIDLFLTGA